MQMCCDHNWTRKPPKSTNLPRWITNSRICSRTPRRTKWTSQPSSSKSTIFPSRTGNSNLLWKAARKRPRCPKTSPLWRRRTSSCFWSFSNWATIWWRLNRSSRPVKNKSFWSASCRPRTSNSCLRIRNSNKVRRRANRLQRPKWRNWKSSWKTSLTSWTFAKTAGY